MIEKVEAAAHLDLLFSTLKTSLMYRVWNLGGGAVFDSGAFGVEVKLRAVCDGGSSAVLFCASVGRGSD